MTECGNNIHADMLLSCFCSGPTGWVYVDRRLFHCCGASVDLELSCLETLLSLEVKGSGEGILYDEIYIFCTCI